MKRLIFPLLCAASLAAQADGVNERTHAPPGAQAKVNRVIAQAEATHQPPKDNVVVYNNLQTQGHGGITLGINNGGHAPTLPGQPVPEQNIVTHDNIVVCLHCQAH